MIIFSSSYPPPDSSRVSAASCFSSTGNSSRQEETAGRQRSHRDQLADKKRHFDDMTRISLFVLAASLIVLISCQGGVSRFQFSTPGGTIRLREKPGLKASEEGTIPTSTYVLTEPYVIEEKDKALSLLYSAAGRALPMVVVITGP